jgi:hypothetical protein
VTIDRITQQQLDTLEDILRSLIGRHEQLGKLLDQQRAAMRRGDADRMTELCRLQNAQIQNISELEKKRLTLVAELTTKAAPDAPEPLKLLDLAQRFPEPMRGRLLVLRQQLVQRMEDVQQKSSVARRAAYSLCKHVTGLVRAIATVSYGGAAYTLAGRVNDKPAVMSTLNMVA